MKGCFSLSHRDLEEMMHMRGVQVDHATLERWVMKWLPLIDQAVRKKTVDSSWSMDETYVKPKGKWPYNYIEQ